MKAFRTVRVMISVGNAIFAVLEYPVLYLVQYAGAGRRGTQGFGQRDEPLTSTATSSTTSINSFCRNLAGFAFPLSHWHSTVQYDMHHGAFVIGYTYSTEMSQDFYRRDVDVSQIVTKTIFQISSGIE